VAYTALFLALTSTGYAASTALLPRNSVGTNQVVDRSLLARDFKRGQLPRGARGPRGRTGAAGAAGAKGDTGSQGPKGDTGADGQKGDAGAAGSPAASMLAARIVGLPAVSFIEGIQTRFGPVSGMASPALDASAVTMISPAVPTVARDLAVTMSAEPLGGNRVTTLLVNGAPSALECMVFGDGVACTDSGDLVPVPAASTLAIRITSVAINPFTLPATDALVSWRATTP
jgi:hypothetical protein